MKLLLNVVEKLISIIIKELNKKDVGGSCVLASYIFKQWVPNSEIVKGFHLEKNITVYIYGLNIIKKFTILLKCKI